MKALSPRERQLTEKVIEGKANKNIAFELGLTQATVKEYLFVLYKKVGVRNRTGLAVWAVENPAALADRCPDTSAVDHPLMNDTSES